MLVEGNLLVANDRMVDVTAGAVTIGLGGVYQADPEAGGAITATLKGGSITIQGGLLEESGAVVNMSGSMVLISEGEVTIGPGGVYQAENPNDASLDATLEAGSITVQGGGTVNLSGSMELISEGQVTIGPGGLYQADPAAKGPVSAVLEAGSITIQGGSLEDGGGGSIVFTDSMAVVIEGDLLLEDDDGGKGCDTPPDLNIAGDAEINIGGGFVLAGRACVKQDSSMAVLLEGDFDNFSIDADIFEWFDVVGSGELQMNGVAQTIEAAGEDRGPWPHGLEDNFAIKTLTLAAGTIVEVIDTFDNQQDGVVACDEALYVDTLIVGPGAVLLTDGCRVYYNNLINDGAVPGLGIDVLQIREPCLADFSVDGETGAFDLAILLGSWGPCPPPCEPEGELEPMCPASCTAEDHAEICSADLSGDCKVGAFDLAILLGSWGPCLADGG